METILLVEDEPAMRKVVSDDLILEGYKVITAKDGAEGLKMALEMKPNLILLDIMLPKMNGLDVCRELKAKEVDVPIIMLTAKGQESDKIIGFRLGVDDYVTKPFSVLELAARIKAVLRRVKTKKQSAIKKYKFEDVVIDFEKYEAVKNGKKLHLSTREFKILKILLENKGLVISRDRFLNEVWGYEQFPTSRTVDNQIMALRQKLEGDKKDSEKHIVTVRGIGYKFQE